MVLDELVYSELVAIHKPRELEAIVWPRLS